MLALALATLIASSGYGFTASTKGAYDIEFAFDGFIPAMGGIEGKVKVKLGIDIGGMERDDAAPLKVAYDLKSFRLFVEEDELPYGIDKVKSYFPKTTVWLNERGKVAKTNALDLKFPVRLPGLDQKKFAESTFLVLEFPESPIENGKKWTYTRAFGDSSIQYDVSVSSVKDDRYELTLKVKQSYDLLEDESKSVVTDPSDAVSKVHTVMTGTGAIVFDRSVGLIKSVTLDTLSTSNVTDLKTQEKSTRKLKMTTKVLLRDKNSPPWD
jgi:hypothetical protein